MRSEKNRFAAWMDEHPVIAGFAVVILYILLRKGTYYLFLHAQGAAFTVIHELVDVIWPFLMVLAFGKIGAYRKGRFFRTLLLGVSLFLYGLLLGFGINLFPLFKESGLEWQTPVMIVWALITMLFVGFREESCYRGIVLRAFANKYMKDRKGVLISVFASAAFFGIMHMANIFVGQSFVECVFQTVSAFFFGSLSAAVYLRGGNLWALMVLHGFTDLGLMSKNLLTKTYSSDAVEFIASHKDTTINPAQLVVNLVLWTIFICLTLFMLRKKKCGEIIERFGSGGNNEKPAETL